MRERVTVLPVCYVLVFAHDTGHSVRGSAIRETVSLGVRKAPREDVAAKKELLLSFQFCRHSYWRSMQRRPIESRVSRCDQVMTPFTRSSIPVSAP